MSWTCDFKHAIAQIADPPTRGGLRSRHAAGAHTAYSACMNVMQLLLLPTFAGPYSPTVTLPSTSFSLRANSTVREPQIQAWWEQQAVYRTMVESNPGVRGG